LPELGGFTGRVLVGTGLVVDGTFPVAVAVGVGVGELTPADETAGDVPPAERDDWCEVQPVPTMSTASPTEITDIQPARTRLDVAAIARTVDSPESFPPDASSTPKR
jgi:hypothetical protein